MCMPILQGPVPSQLDLLPYGSTQVGRVPPLSNVTPVKAPNSPLLIISSVKEHVVGQGATCSMPAGRVSSHGPEHVIVPCTSPLSGSSAENSRFCVTGPRPGWSGPNVNRPPSRTPYPFG